MVFFSIIAFYFLHTSYALSLVSPSGSGIGRRQTAQPNVLGPVAELHIGNEIVAPDGFNRSATLVNGVYPGPLIQAQKNDRFVLQVFNELTDDTMPLETSVHWHGIFQSTSNWADGVDYVTQCPILPGQNFVYNFTSLNQTGTYWYHSHASTQYCDGLRGPLVIYDPADPLAYMYDVDDENTVITLSDWYHTPSPQLAAIFGNVLSDSTLINGRGRYPGGPLQPLTVIDVTPGLRYRLRVLGLACDLTYNFTIDGHRMTIIEVEGNEVLPVEVDSIPIFAGQRYSVVITANQPVANYWIRADGGQANQIFDGGMNSAILRYAGAPDEDPTSVPGPYELSFDESTLHPLISPGAPGTPEIGQADVNLNIVAGFQIPPGLFLINGVSWVNPPITVLLQILSGARSPSELLPGGSVYPLPLNQVIEISFPNNGEALGGPHPIHLHGHSFDVVRVAGNSTPNFVNPVRRDVVSLGAPGDNVTIRFVTDNPGPWFLHCHVDWHLHHGFAAVLAEASEQAALQQAAVVPGTLLRMPALRFTGSDHFVTAAWGQLCVPPTR
ncbi:laccase [Paxillus rubicundulus Ve08.2h10]|uniref:Unplaced genomic scaffold scaffold_551, whole genome shotgun sequence n=1 Tax=Paxillus rubicundulus Ve08.2h10 TaxID=930991 RepID=A0A0D0D4Q8_9AGAM|nr:laccase [Paxillus rubicundulus Ve08.2h10]